METYSNRTDRSNQAEAISKPKEQRKLTFIDNRSLTASQSQLKEIMTTPVQLSGRGPGRGGSRGGRGRKRGGSRGGRKENPYGTYTPQEAPKPAIHFHPKPKKVSNPAISGIPATASPAKDFRPNPKPAPAIPEMDFIPSTPPPVSIDWEPMMLEESNPSDQRQADLFMEEEDLSDLETIEDSSMETPVIVWTTEDLPDMNTPSTSGTSATASQTVSTPQIIECEPNIFDNPKPSDQKRANPFREKPKPVKKSVWGMVTPESMGEENQEIRASSRFKPKTQKPQQSEYTFEGSFNTAGAHVGWASNKYILPDSYREFKISQTAIVRGEIIKYKFSVKMRKRGVTILAYGKTKGGKHTITHLQDYQ